MNLIPTALTLCATLLLVACGERAANVAQPKHYDKDGLTFLYPGNWQIDEDDNTVSVRLVSLTTTGEGMAVVQIFPLEIAGSLEDYAQAFSDETAAAVPMGKLTGSKFTPQPDADGYKCLKETCTMKLMGQSTPHVRYYRSRDFGNQRCYLFCQVADEDLKNFEEGFKQIASSLDLAPPAAPKAP